MIRTISWRCGGFATARRVCVFEISLHDTLNFPFLPSMPMWNSLFTTPRPGRALPCPPVPKTHPFAAAPLTRNLFHPKPLTGLLPAEASPSWLGSKLFPCPQAGLSLGNRQSRSSEAGWHEILCGYPRGSRVLGTYSPGWCWGTGSMCVIVSSSSTSPGPSEGGFGPRAGSGKLVVAPAFS